MEKFDIKESLSRLNIDRLNEMQEESLDHFGKGSNLYLLSPTGSGKTLAFLIPLIQKLDPKLEDVQALILCPSRELALQIESVFKQLKTGYKVNCCYGGHAMKVEKNNLLSPPSVLIGTPGRIADHLRNERFKVSQIHTLILDEFDKSLEFGFLKDMEFLYRGVRYINQRVLISATDLEELPEFIENVEFTKINHLDKQKKLDINYQIVDPVGDELKVDSLIRLVSNHIDDKVIIFFNHQDAVNRISLILKEERIAHAVFHGGLKQDQRERELIKLRNGSTNLILATDLAARGIDIPEIKCIIHYQIPLKEDAFVHRNGRTARMNASGTVYLLRDSETHMRDFIDSNTAEIIAPEKKEVQTKTEFTTIYMDLGKKNKISKMDIVGFFCKQGGLQKDEIGLIEVKDFTSYIAVASKKTQSIIDKLSGRRIKNKKVVLKLSK